MQQVAVINDDRFTQHLEGIPHLESAKRITASHVVLQDPSLYGRWSAVEPRLASKEELAMVHTPEYIDRIARSAGKPYTVFDLDTQATALSYEVARLGVGAVFVLLDNIWNGNVKRGFAFIRPPGHHAEPDKAMGFCLFNNVAIGARYLREHYPARRIMIVDIDAHHGNGIQKAFYNENDILYVSMHQFPGYPGTGNFGEVGQGKGEGFTVNIPLGRGHSDQDFARIIYFLLNPLAQAFHPEMILVSCGFDLYEHDRLGEMRVTPGGYALITFFLLDIAQKICDGRIAFIMEGGYSLKGIRECGLRVMQELCDVPSLSRRDIDKITRGSIKSLPAIRKTVEIQKKYWKILAGAIK